MYIYWAGPVQAELKFVLHLGGEIRISDILPKQEYHPETYILVMSSAKNSAQSEDACVTGDSAKSEGNNFSSYVRGAVSSLNPVRRTSASADKKVPDSAPKEVEANSSSSLTRAVTSTGNMIMKGVSGAVHAVNYLNPMAYDYNSDDDDDDPPPAAVLRERNLAEDPERADVLRRKESALAVMLRCAKNKYVEKGLEGKITIQILYGVITSGEFCSVSRADAPVDVHADEMKQLGECTVCRPCCPALTDSPLATGVLNFKAVSAMDAILANLNRRAKQYDTEALRLDVTLTQGVSFGVSIPLVYVGFQTSIQFEVTARSLIQYRKRKHKLRAFMKKLKSIPHAEQLVEDVMRGGFSREVAQRAVVATDGRGEMEALRWAADHDAEYTVVGNAELSDHTGTAV